MRPIYLNKRACTAAKGAQKAHEAIRPSDVKLKTADLSSVEPDAQNCTTSSGGALLRAKSRMLVTSSAITVSAGDFELKARGRVMRFAARQK